MDRKAMYKLRYGNAVTAETISLVDNDSSITTIRINKLSMCNLAVIR